MQIAPVAAWPVAPPAPVPAPGTPTPPVGFDHIFDFPGISTGQHFHLDKGSTVNGWSISGEGRIDAMTPNSGTVWIKGGKFGFHREASITVTQTSPTSVHLVANQPGQQPVAVDADIVAVRTGYSEFHPTSMQAKNAVMQQTADGKFVVDVEDALDKLTLHLVLAKDAALAVQPAA